MPVFCVEIRLRSDGLQPPSDQALTATLRQAGLTGIERAHTVRLFFLEGGLSRADAERVAADLLVDPVTETFVLRDSEGEHQPEAGLIEFEVHRRPGVMDSAAESTLMELRAEGLEVDAVRTACRYVVAGRLSESEALATARRVLANDCIEEVVLGTAGVRPVRRPPVFRFELRHVMIRELDDTGLEELSRRGHLFLSLDEMRTIQAHFRRLGRNPTDLELETLAQTWSEHCVHKTLRSAVVYRGAPLPPTGDDQPVVERRYDNLLKDTIVRATEELIAAGRGPECLSVFKDNAGVIRFNERFGVAFKVETHNHPSAIEPYGGAATGIGGCIRDVIGCGLGARPVASTDVFCVAPSDWPADALPKGVLHPLRVLRGIAKGVADYGNRMGIPTVNGAVYFDPRYLGNPLVYCGSVGLIPSDLVEKAAQPGDLVVLIGGRTGRDGIHGATFSSAELTDSHADEFSHAVQIGNAITEKRFLDAVLRARDDEIGCLYNAITDCGAGGLSSAVGEMAEHVGATVELEKVPLKYAGLRYDEIWISEAQERMVLAVPPANLERFLRIMLEDEVEATVIGTFGTGSADAGARLVLHYDGQVVGDLDLHFLHEGWPRRERVAEWRPPERWPAESADRSPNVDLISALKQQLGRPNVAAKEWVIRQYDHEVQGGSVVKPLVGPGQGPGDAAVLRLVGDSQRGIAIGCGLAPQLSDEDPYWMAVAAIDEAIRNVVSVGGDPRQTAILDNFCWGRSDDPHQLGGLVRACQACYDAAKAYEVPFISGKDSLNNEFALDRADIEPLLESLQRFIRDSGPDAEHLRRIWNSLAARVRRTQRVSIPGTLLISAVSIVPDVRRCITPDLKTTGNHLLLVGGLPRTGFALTAAANVHALVAEALRHGLIVTCHDCSEGGWLTSLAEMAIAGRRGAVLPDQWGGDCGPFDEISAAYVIETPDFEGLQRLVIEHGSTAAVLGRVSDDDFLAVGARRVAVMDLRAVWAV